MGPAAILTPTLCEAAPARARRGQSRPWRKHRPLGYTATFQLGLRLGGGGGSRGERPAPGWLASRKGRAGEPPGPPVAPPRWPPGTVPTLPVPSWAGCRARTRWRTCQRPGHFLLRPRPAPR